MKKCELPSLQVIYAGEKVGHEILFPRDAADTDNHVRPPQSRLGGGNLS